MNTLDAEEMTRIWSELGEEERTLFMLCLIFVVFVWYGLILGMMFED